MADKLVWSISAISALLYW